MVDLHLRHSPRWDLSPEEARQVQRDLRDEVRVQPFSDRDVRRVAGVDAAFTGDKILAAAVVLNYTDQQAVEQAGAVSELRFPYIPGLLSFRETPGYLAALAQLSTLPDVLIVDGHGYAHPRRFGIACHLGVLLDLPTIGCAKSLLVGKVSGELGEDPGSQAEILDHGEVVGVAVRTRRNTKPVYVTVGQRVDLPSAVRIVLACGRGYRLPEPTRLAHSLAAKMKGDLS